MMIDKDNGNTVDAVTIESNPTKSQVNVSIELSVDAVTPDNPPGEEQSVQNSNNDKSNGAVEQIPENSQVSEGQFEEEEHLTSEEDEFIRITAAHQMLTEAQTYDERKNYPAALHLYRICVDLLLEELMFTEGTEQSRVYLREKCTAIMDRVDLLKTMLDPLPPSADSTQDMLPLEQSPFSLTSALSPPSPPPLTTTTTTTTTTSKDNATANDETTNLPTEALNSLHLS